MVRLISHMSVLVHDAGRRALPTLRALVADPDPEVAAMIAYTLGWFPDDAAPSIEVLRAAADADRGDGVLAATSLISIARLGGPVADAWLRDPRPLVRWGAAIGLGRLRPDDPPAEALRILTREAPGLASPDGRIPHFNGNLFGYAAATLRVCGPRHADFTYEQVLARITDPAGPRRRQAVALALRLAWPDGPAETPTDRRRRCAAVLADAGFGGDPEIVELAAIYGIAVG
jgi:HEAT repeat protein